MQLVTNVSPFRAQFDSQVSQLNAQREAQKKAMLSRYGAMRILSQPDYLVYENQTIRFYIFW